MINFVFKYNGKTVASGDLAALFKKDVERMMYEALQIHAKELVLKTLEPIREQMENENGTIECSFDKVSSQFNFQIQGYTKETAEKIEELMKAI